MECYHGHGKIQFQLHEKGRVLPDLDPLETKMKTVNHYIPIVFNFHRLGYLHLPMRKQ